MSDYVNKWLVWQVIVFAVVYSFARDLVRKTLGWRTPA